MEAKDIQDEVQIDANSDEFNFKCKFCGRNMSSRQNLKEHTYIHSGERPYVCKVEGCNQTFRQGSLLSIHKRIHKEILKQTNIQKTNKKITYLTLTRVLKVDENHYHVPLEEEERSTISSSIKEGFFFIRDYLIYP